MSRRLRHLSFAIAATLALAAIVPQARAYESADAAKISEDIRPNFGILLRPGLDRHRHRSPWRGRRYGYSESYGPGPYLPYVPPYGPGGGRDSVTVDCGDPTLGPTPISDAAEWVVDGGTVYVRARGVACKETIQIDHPVIIAGEEESVYSTNPEPSPVTIAPRDGQPCVLVAQGVKEVELRGLHMVAPKGGDTSCVLGWDSEVALVRDDIDYSGDASAIYISGGKLVMRESRVDAHTYDAAIVTEKAGLDLLKVRVRGDAIGMDLTLGALESEIERVGVLHGAAGGAGSSGIIVRGQRSGGGLLKIRNAVVCGWRVGVGIERGGRAEIRRSRICRTSFGVMSDGGDVGVEESAIGADHIGVYITAGSGRVNRNRIFDLSDPRDGVVGEDGAGVTAEANWLYLKPGCDHFDWDGRHFCKPVSQLPFAMRDESAFDRDYRDGWDVDGYEDGYMRDGPVTPFDKPRPAPKPRGKHLILFKWK